MREIVRHRWAPLGELDRLKRRYWFRLRPCLPPFNDTEAIGSLNRRLAPQCRARVKLRQGDTEHSLDLRRSDAHGLAIRAGAPVYA